MTSASETLKAKIHGIVVGVDGSEVSQLAIDWAARDAALRGVPLTLVHVLPAEVEPWIDIPVAEDFLAARDRRAEQVINDALRVVVVAASDRRDIAVEHQILSGHAVPALVELSKDADMIVAGSRGLGGVEGLLLGSVSSGLVHHAYCPVAVIHDDSRLLNDAAIAPVVVGVDGSPASELATAIAFDEASRRKAELVAVHTWMNHADFYVDVAWDAVATQAEEELAQRLAGWSERYPEVIVRRVVGQDNPVSRLLKESSRAQLLVVGSHGRGGFAGLLLGSVSSALAHASRIPVIVARS